MCGIIAYKGKTCAIDTVVEGLKRLEYRGYDSWGVACRLNQDIFVKKEVGKIGDVVPEQVMPAECMRCTTAIGHTRWATHGAVSQANAHPQLSENKQIAVVHNGIIENSERLCADLQRQGMRFVSQTDTEVIPQSIQYHMGQGDNFREAFRRTLQELQGSFAIVAIHESSDEILFGRQGSPLVLGIGEGEYFIGSDAAAFLAHTRRTITVGDGEYGSIGDAVHLWRISDDHVVEPRQQTIGWSVEPAQKGDYAHFMLKEIAEQEQSILRSSAQVNTQINKCIALLKCAHRIFLVGCGTSYHACMSAGYQFSRIAQADVCVVLGSEFRNYECFLTDKTPVIVVSQSGETADVIDAALLAKNKGAKIISIVNVPGSSLQRLSDESIMMNAGPEICVCSTKSYTSQLALLTLLAYGLIDRLSEGKKVIYDAAVSITHVIRDSSENAKKLAKVMQDRQHCFLIGRGSAYPSALEGALKIKEVSYVHAEGFAGGELKHGTIALIEQGTPVIVFATQETEQLINSNASEIKARGGLIIGIGSQPHKTYDYYFHVPDAGNASPLLMMIPVQLLAYYLAVERCCDPDKPRNLAKCVTVR